MLEIDKIKRFIEVAIASGQLSPEEIKDANNELETIEFIENPYVDLLDGTIEFCEDGALLYLIYKETVWIRSGMKNPDEFSIIVNCNDLFYWASADGEEITHRDIESLFKMEKEHPAGSSKWCCLKRGMRPQTPIEKKWKELGWWDDDLEALPLRDPKSCG